VKLKRDGEHQAAMEDEHVGGVERGRRQKKKMI
jgi:hypothetical protein